MADGLLPQARWHGAGCGDVLVGAVSSRPTQQVSPPSWFVALLADSTAVFSAPRV
jgi:hypothetical protein